MSDAVQDYMLKPNVLKALYAGNMVSETCFKLEIRLTCMIVMAH